MKILELTEKKEVQNLEGKRFLILPRMKDYRIKAIFKYSSLLYHLIRIYQFLHLLDGSLCCYNGLIVVVVPLICFGLLCYGTHWFSFIGEGHNIFILDKNALLFIFYTIHSTKIPFNRSSPFRQPIKILSTTSSTTCILLLTLLILPNIPLNLS